ncbi:unnamed protein product [Moneuplotes crassus]|uniref:Uncharacterized protein n=1 Tax=Euplotes crassus TaxID=5936 RepID=A0AAD1UD20_EUPCR|nr:unnamed protein product [Moneuplotes crassus]
MEHLSPGSELSESFLTPPKPHILINETILATNNTRKDRDLETPSSPKIAQAPIPKTNYLDASLTESKLRSREFDTPDLPNRSQDNKDLVLIQSALKEIKNSLTASALKENISTNAFAESKMGESRIKKLHDIVSYDKSYTLRESLQKSAFRNSYRDNNYPKHIEILDKLEMVEQKMALHLRNQESRNDFGNKSNRIEQTRFSYVLRTIETNLESLIDKIQRCHPGQAKNNYSFLKFSKPSESSRRLEGSLLQRSSILSTPQMVSEEVSIESIFKLLTRADKSLDNLSGTLKNESKFKTQLSRKLDFQNVNSSEFLQKSLETKFDQYKVELESEFNRKIGEITRKNDDIIESLQRDHRKELEEHTKQWEMKLTQCEEFFQNQLNNTIEKIKAEYFEKLYAFQGDSSLRSSQMTYDNNFNEIKLQTFRNYINPDISKGDSQIIFNEELEKSKTEIMKEEEKKYKRFIEEFTEYRKQEVDMFKSTQITFVKNLQREVNHLTDIIQKVIQNPKGSQKKSKNIDLYNLQDSIENVSNNLQNYFSRVSHNSNEESYFSGHSNAEAQRQCKSQNIVVKEGMNEKYF